MVAVSVRVRVAGAVAVALAVVATPLQTTDASAETGFIDRSTRESTVAAYKQRLLPALNTKVTFSSPPNIQGCGAGTESVTSRDATMNALNYTARSLDFLR